MFSILLLISLIFSWQDLCQMEISAWLFLSSFACLLIFSWESWDRALVFLLLALLARRIPLGMGEGDFCLLALYSLSYSLLECIFILFFACVLALIFTMLFLLFTRRWLKILPFVPFLTISLVIYNGLFTSWLSILTGYL